MLALLYDIHGNLPALEAVLDDTAGRGVDRWLLGVGFRHEGVLRDWHRHGGRHHDVNVFGLLRDEWEAGPLRDVPVRVEGAVPAALRRAGQSRYDPAAPGATTRA